MITNMTSGKNYIGQTKLSLKERFNDHYELKKNTSAIHSALRKYGKSNFQIQELYIAFDESSLNFAEKVLIEIYNTLSPNGYNLKTGGNRPVYTEEARLKISQSKKGCKSPRKGAVLSNETKLQISRKLGGSAIKATNLISGEERIYITAHSTSKDGFNPSNIVQICKGHTGRSQSKGWKFSYLTKANQNGSEDNKRSLHVPRLESETVNTEYNLSKSSQLPNY